MVLFLVVGEEVVEGKQVLMVLTAIVLRHMELADVVELQVALLDIVIVAQIELGAANQPVNGVVGDFVIANPV
jgi:hypothetical protein